MLTVRKAEERGHFDHGWLQTNHTFSFASYQDPQHMGFRTLRVINEDVVQGGQGFGTHPHRDMEIVTYIVGGTLEHRDSTGTSSVIRAGEVQRMTAGTGVTHSEYNPSPVEPVHLLQIWILPEKAGLAPSYEQRYFSEEEKRGRLRPLVTPDGREGSLTIHQDASLFASSLAAGQQVSHRLEPSRHAWLQLIRGVVGADGVSLKAGDAVAVSEEDTLTVSAREAAEFLLFDLG